MPSGVCRSPSTGTANRSPTRWRASPTQRLDVRSGRTRLLQLLDRQGCDQHRHAHARRACLFGYDTPVVDLWPEFGAHGKHTVTVRHVLNHSAGVPGIPLDTTVEDLCDWDTICAAIADAELWWEPGTQFGYHAYTFGYIVGEIARRTTGKPISQVLLEEVSGPLGVPDELYFGMPESEHHRLARLEDEEGSADASAEMISSLPPDLPMFKAAPMTLYPRAEASPTPTPPPGSPSP